MIDGLFRKKSMDSISSPDEIADYIRVANPSIWIILAAIVIFLIGVITWGFFGRLESYFDSAAIAKNGSITAYADEDQIAEIQVGMEVEIGGRRYPIVGISEEPVSTSAGFSDYFLELGFFNDDRVIYPLMLEGTLQDGIYKAEIILESVQPADFVIN